MALAVILPKIGEAMTSGKITKWLKKEGDRVEKGEAIFEVETEKVNFEVEAEASGILSKIMAEIEDDIAVGTTIAFILQPGEKPSETKAIKASPLAKRIAKENNVDLSLVAGTGPGGRISKEDVLKAIGNRYVGGHW